jgi:hypothetical protein
MSLPEPNPRFSMEGPARVRAARYLAMAADVVQIAVFPLFAGGALSPWNDALDVAVAAVLTKLVGWHWAFLPSFVAELVPGLDLVPTWTAAVFFVTRRAGRVPPAHAIDAEVISSKKVPDLGAGPIR